MFFSTLCLLVLRKANTNVNRARTTVTRDATLSIVASSLYRKKQTILKMKKHKRKRKRSGCIIGLTFLKTKRIKYSARRTRSAKEFTMINAISIPFIRS